MKSNILLSLLILLLCSCVEKSANFLEPQPADTKNLKQFSPELLGIYESLDGGENIEILGNQLIQSGNYDIKMSKSEIDTSQEYILKSNVLFNVLDSTEIPVELRNDSIFGFIPWADTAFIISETNILRKMDGYFFINKYTSDSIWKVVRLKLDQNVLKLATINKLREAEEIKKYTALYEVTTKNDTITDYKLKPAKREFRKMNASEFLFMDEEKYVKTEELTPKNPHFIFFR